jgi:transcription termination/antitermination protein NusG
MKPRFSYSIGEMVRIKTGPFQSFSARIEEVDEEKARLKVRVKIFGNRDLVELGFLDVEKLAFTEEE